MALTIKTPWGPMPISAIEHDGVRITENNIWKYDQKVDTKDMSLRIMHVLNQDSYWEAVVIDPHFSNRTPDEKIKGKTCAEAHDNAVKFIQNRKLGIPKGFKVSPTPGATDADDCALGWDTEDHYFQVIKINEELASYYVWIVPA